MEKQKFVWTELEKRPAIISENREADYEKHCLYLKDKQIGIRDNMKVAAQIERVQMLMDEILQVHLLEGHAFKIVIEGKRSKVESVRAGMIRKTQNGRWVEEIECWKGGKFVDGGMG